jgi:hypothetical protein
MQHQAVDSGMLASVGYDPSTLTLEVKFKRGETYAYDGVPADVHEAFINADSVGSFFSKAIKSSFPSRKVSADGTSTPVVAPAPKAVATPEPTPQPGPLVLVATSIIPALDEEKLKTELNLIKVESKELDDGSGEHLQPAAAPAGRSQDRTAARVEGPDRTGLRAGCRDRQSRRRVP